MCPIADGRFRCEVAAAILDARLRCEACTADYRSNLDVQPMAVTDVGTVHLMRGATLSGRVEAGKGVRLGLDRVIVRATPADFDPASDTKRFVPRSIKVDAKGQFHFDGLTPGQYDVVAVADPYSSLKTRVTSRLI